MQALMEPIFHIVYLSTVIFIGLRLIKKSKGNDYFNWFGIMAVTLGFGDAFHLIPRIIALWTTGFESHAASLGFGKFVTSITMTIFYLILYTLWKKRFNITNVTKLDQAMWLLATLRIVLCFFPQNQWFIYESSITWAIYRNIPFAIMGLLMIYLLYTSGVKHNDKNAKKMALAVVLSFAFYIPVVLWAQVNILIGMLMIPKTIAYLWIVFIGYSESLKAS
jgi:hypothetical protein